MIPRLFGTDGIRGRANQAPMTPDVVVKVGQAVAAHFQRSDVQANTTQPDHPFYTAFNPYVEQAGTEHPLTVVVGKDTRLSGYMIESALVAGLVSQGAHVIMLGPLPTPAVAILTRSLRAAVGIMISASHNPYFDNGIKFFDARGVKFSRETEMAIEQLVFEGVPSPQGECGKSIRLDDSAGRYVEFAKATFPKGQDLAGMKIVLDCANGAAYKVAPRIFWELGASVIPLGNKPNGRNINEQCGALHPDHLRECVLESQADLGIALDGDADRLILMTPQGHAATGDQILAMIARQWQQCGSLSGGVVSTTMSNAALKTYLTSLGLQHFESDVGDKHVVELMRQTHSNLGGEESGHIILSDYTTTGDGIIAALQVLSVAKASGKTLDELFPVFQPFPQLIRSVPWQTFMTPQYLADLKMTLTQRLSTDSHVVLRKSGTESVLRIMLQGPDAAELTELMDEVTREGALQAYV